MLHSENNKFKIALALYLLLASQSSANEKNLSYEIFSFAKKARSELSISGISTKVLLGAAGINVKYSLSSKQVISAKVGIGYHPSYSTRYREVTLTGPVHANLYGLEFSQKLYSNNFITIYLDAEYMKANLKANKLKGRRANLDILASNKTIIEDKKLGLQFESALNANGKAFFGIGKNGWDIQAQGISVIDDDTTLKKQVATNYIDPYFTIGYEFDLNGAILKFVYEQSVMTVDTKIKVDSLSLKYSINF